MVRSADSRSSTGRPHSSRAEAADVGGDAFARGVRRRNRRRGDGQSRARRQPWRRRRTPTPAADDRDTEADGDDSGGDDDEEEEVVAEGDAAAEIGGGGSLGASVDLLASVDDGTTVVDVEMGGGERRDSTASIPDLE